MTASRRAGALLPLALVALSACQPQPPEGALACQDNGDCPSGFTCAPDRAGDRRCFQDPPDAGAPDAGRDAGASDGGRDAGPDGGTADAGPPPTPLQLGLGLEHSCLLYSDGQLYCWGDNRDGELAIGVESSDPQTLPAPARELPDGILEVSAAETATCVRTATDVWCWGSQGPSGVGVLGVPSITGSTTPVETRITADEVFDLDVGAQHACAVVGPDRTVECWGENGMGQLGLGDRMNRVLPDAVAGLSGVTSICAGDEHTCVALEGGVVQCWGAEAEGRLGNGEDGVGVQTVPLTVPGLAGVTELACGQRHTCVRSGATGEVRCWGPNTGGQVGVDELGRPPVTSPTPLPAAIAPDIEVLALGGRSTGVFALQSNGFTCAFGADLRLHCWGWNDVGQLGLESRTPANTPEPQQVSTLDRTVGLALGGGHACALEAEGEAIEVWCWGQGDRGQLGNANSDGSDAPVRVLGLP